MPRTPLGGGPAVAGAFELTRPASILGSPTAIACGCAALTAFIHAGQNALPVLRSLATPSSLSNPVVHDLLAERIAEHERLFDRSISRFSGFAPFGVEPPRPKPLPKPKADVKATEPSPLRPASRDYPLGDGCPPMTGHLAEVIFLGGVPLRVGDSTGYVTLLDIPSPTSVRVRVQRPGYEPGDYELTLWPVEWAHQPGGFIEQKPQNDR
ncbi:MAG: hypothetical protein JNL80_05870 [Phycisphaerae bacterium]|jgi:hypothetical protein|nr:hypothetical protein [Phycisphaerae bacterium]